MAVVQESDFGAARNLFAMYCKAKGLSGRTLETYLASVDKLGTFLARSGRGDGIPSPQDIRALVASLLDRSLARTTISIMLRSVRCFFGFLAREQIISASPMANVEIPRLPTRYPEVLTETEIKAILARRRNHHGQVPAGVPGRVRVRHSHRKEKGKLMDLVLQDVVAY